MRQPDVKDIPRLSLYVLLHCIRVIIPEWHVLVESRNIHSLLTENVSYPNLLHIRLMRVITLFFIVAMLTKIINFS